MLNRNIAVIGTGFWGQNLVRNFAELGALHTICDSDEAKLERLKSLYPGVIIEPNYQRVLSNQEIEGVVIATPAISHYPVAKEALGSGKDIFIEKPLALSVEEGEELVELAEKDHRILLVGHLLEYHPAIVKLKELIDNGELGKIDYLYSNRLNLGRFRTEENILWSFAPHDISVILLLLGEMPKEISAHGGYYLHQDIADVTLTTLEFKKGVRAHIFVSWLHPYKEQKLIVVGDKKMAMFDDTNPKDKLFLYSHKIDWVNRKPVPSQSGAESVSLQLQEPLKLECQDFLECIQKRNKPKVDGRKGLQVLRVLSYCQRSLEDNGRIVSLNENLDNVFIHHSSIVENGCKIGTGTKIWHFSHIMPDVAIGKNCVIGQNVFVGKKVKLGNNVKVENNVSLFEGVTLEDNVFCGPSCVFTNVTNPRSGISRKHAFKPTLVKKGATIGANATIVCGNTIGSHAFIGAGALVSKDIPEYALVYGNPARVHGWICECGVKLDFAANGLAECNSCGQRYRKQENKKGVTAVKKL
jgi:UDP-2-acetamido-3-amino-2,3-dideoxy-glucuronate N-acetyltransferase